MANILVTGATGYLGARIIRTLLTSTDDVVFAMARQPSKFRQLSQWCKVSLSRLQMLDGDVCKLSNLPEGIDTIVHTAAQRDEQQKQSYAEMIQVNIQGTCNLLCLAAHHKIERFIYISSQSVYGKQSAPWNERAQPDPQTVYAMTKYAAEQLVWTYRDVINFVILRLSHIYGVSLFMRWDELVGKFVRLIQDDRSLSVYGDGTQRIDLVHIEDVVQCVLRLLQIYPRGWNDIYNVGSGRSISINELVECLSQITVEQGLSPIAIEQHTQIAYNSQLHIELDISHARNKLGWSPHQTLPEGLREYLENVNSD